MRLAALLIQFFCSAAFCIYAYSASAETPLLTFEPFQLETLHGSIPAEIAYLQVPQRHAEPTGASFRLRVVRLAAREPRALPPVVYLAGGPGGSGVGTARRPRWPIFDRARQHVDVLFFDQRGTGDSQPPPVCSLKIEPNWQQPLEEAAATQAIRSLVQGCAREWQQQGIDLNAYTTRESAADLEQLRQALGVDQLQLWGMSYGTHLAMATLRDHPAGIARALLMGAEGPDHTLKLPFAADRLLDVLSVDAQRQGFPDLRASTERVLATLRQRPGVARSLLLGGTKVTIGAFDVQLAMTGSLGFGSTQALLPLALQQAEGGDYGALVDLVVMVRQQLREWNAMPLLMDIASGASPDRRALIAEQSAQSLFGDALNFPFTTLMDEPGLPDLGEAFRGPLASQHPILMISGSRDGRTPVANAVELLPLMPHATHLILEGAAHDDELWLSHPQIGEHIAAFLEGKPVPDQTLPITVPPLPRSTAEVLLDMLGLTPWGAGGIGLAVLVGIIGMLWLLRRGWRAWRRRGRRATLQ